MATKSIFKIMDKRHAKTFLSAQGKSINAQVKEVVLRKPLKVATHDDVVRLFGKNEEAKSEIADNGFIIFGENVDRMKPEAKSKLLEMAKRIFEEEFND